MVGGETMHSVWRTEGSDVAPEPVLVLEAMPPAEAVDLLHGDQWNKRPNRVLATSRTTRQSFRTTMAKMGKRKNATRPPPPLLTFEELLSAQAVFNKNRWSVVADNTQPNAELFDRTARMLERLLSEERDLILRLLGRFKWITQDQYQAKFLDAWNLLEQQIPWNSHVLVTRLVRGKTKSNSSGVVLYSMVEYMQQTLLYRMKNFENSLGVYDSIAVAWRHLNTSKHNSLVIVDDFVGSGKSVLAALERPPPSANVKTFVVALATMREGMRALSNSGVTVCTGCVLDKGISGNPMTQPTDCATMKNIEAFLKIKPYLKFGYEQSESLAALIRTPNNTFPVFWTNSKAGKVPWVAPFERFKRVDK